MTEVCRNVFVMMSSKSRIGTLCRRFSPGLPAGRRDQFPWECGTLDDKT